MIEVPSRHQRKAFDPARKESASPSGATLSASGVAAWRRGSRMVNSITTARTTPGAPAAMNTTRQPY